MIVVLITLENQIKPVCEFDERICLPGDSSKDAGGWHNGFWLGTCVCGELTGEGVRLGILRSGAKKVIQPATGEGSSRLKVNSTVVQGRRRQRLGGVLTEHRS